GTMAAARVNTDPNVRVFDAVRPCDRRVVALLLPGAQARRRCACRAHRQTQRRSGRGVWRCLAGRAPFDCELAWRDVDRAGSNPGGIPGLTRTTVVGWQRPVSLSSIRSPPKPAPEVFVRS